MQGKKLSEYRHKAEKGRRQAHTVWKLHPCPKRAVGKTPLFYIIDVYDVTKVEILKFRWKPWAWDSIYRCTTTSQSTDYQCT